MGFGLGPAIDVLAFVAIVAVIVAVGCIKFFLVVIIVIAIILPLSVFFSIQTKE